MNDKEIRQAALVTLCPAIRQRFPPGPERDRWLQWVDVGAVAGWLDLMYPQDETRQVSHETIYRTLFIQARGALKKELLQHLRRTRRMRRSRLQLVG